MTRDTRRAFLRNLGLALLIAPMARLGRLLPRPRRRRLTRADLSPIPWIGHC